MWSGSSVFRRVAHGPRGDPPGSCRLSPASHGDRTLQGATRTRIECSRHYVRQRHRNRFGIIPSNGATELQD